MEQSFKTLTLVSREIPGLGELDVTAGDTVAFVTALLRCGSKEELAKDGAPRLRLTIGLRKIDGAWKIAHEHHSFPLEL